MRKSVEFIKDRENEIVSFVESRGSIHTDDICKRFNVSVSTARNQLNSLSDRGLIQRTHGGATALPNSKGSPAPAAVGAYEDRQSIANLQEKVSIAKAARKLIAKYDIIGICGGTTTYLLAKELRDAENLTVVTNSVWVANELCTNPNIDVRMSGGILNHKKGSLTGPLAESFFMNVHVDKVFIGADAISVNYGVTSGDANMSYLESTIVEQAQRVFILADHTKFDKNVTIDAVVTFSNIDTVISDAALRPDTVQLILASGVNLVISE